MKGHEANSLMLSTHFVFLLALIPKDQRLKVVLMWVCCLSAFPGESPEFRGGGRVAPGV